MYNTYVHILDLNASRVLRLHPPFAIIYIINTILRPLLKHLRNSRVIKDWSTFVLTWLRRPIQASLPCAAPSFMLTLPPLELAWASPYTPMLGCLQTPLWLPAFLITAEADLLLKRISAALFHQLVHWMRQSREREKPALQGDDRGSSNVGETSCAQMEMAREGWSETQGLGGLCLPENQTWTENKLESGFPLFYWSESW